MLGDFRAKRSQSLSSTPPQCCLKFFEHISVADILFSVDREWHSHLAEATVALYYLIKKRYRLGGGHSLPRTQFSQRLRIPQQRFDISILLEEIVSIANRNVGSIGFQVFIEVWWCLKVYLCGGSLTLRTSRLHGWCGLFSLTAEVV